MARVGPTIPTEENDPETPVEIDPITGEPVNQPGVRVDMEKQKKASRQLLIDQGANRPPKHFAVLNLQP